MGGRVQFRDRLGLAPPDAGPPLVQFALVGLDGVLQVLDALLTSLDVVLALDRVPGTASERGRGAGADDGRDEASPAHKMDDERTP